MAIVRIKNLSNRLLIIRGNSGNSIHLMPDIVLENVDEVEIVNNSKVKKLIDSQLISIEKVKQEKKEKEEMKTKSAKD